MSKGSVRRPRQTTRQEDELRWALATGKITFTQYEYKFKLLRNKGLIRRSGRRL